LGRAFSRFSSREKFLKKKPDEGNNAAPSVFRWLGALICPPAQARRCPASALPARGFFCACKFVICSREELADIGWRSRLDSRGATRVEARLRRRGRPSVNDVNSATREIIWIGADISAGRGTIQRRSRFRCPARFFCPPALARCCPAPVPPARGFFIPDGSPRNRGIAKAQCV
jgi:hypothetical protein